MAQIGVPVEAGQKIALRVAAASCDLSTAELIRAVLIAVGLITPSSTDPSPERIREIIETLELEVNYEAGLGS